MLRAFSAAFLLLLSIQQPRTPEPPLTLVRSVELPHVEGRIDHLALDPTGHKLFIAALGNNTVEVVDVAQGRHLQSLPGYREPQGVARVSDSGLIAVAEGQGEGIRLLDANEPTRTQRIALGEDADNVRYDPKSRVLYAGYGDGAIAAVSTRDSKVIATVRLRAHPESFQLEPDGS